MTSSHQGDPINGKTVGAYARDRWLLERLPLLQGIGPLLPGAANKMPTVGENWPEHPGLSIADLQQAKPTCICWHIGAEHCHYIAIDIDGLRAIEFCVNNGLDPLTADTWRIVRTSSADRLKLVFRVMPEQKAILAAGSKSVRVGAGVNGDNDPGEELAIFRKPGNQIVVLGSHYTKESNYTAQDDMYAWRGRAPHDATFLPAEWFAFLQGVFCGDRPLRPLTRRVVSSRNPAPSGNGHRRSGGGAGWRNSSERLPCPICGRTHSGACSISSTGDAVWCMHGDTCSAPDCSKAGDVITGHSGSRYGYVRTEEHDSFGERSLFVLHTERIDYTHPAPDWEWDESMLGMQPLASSRQALEDLFALPLVPPEDDEDRAATAAAVAQLHEAATVTLTLEDVLPDGLARPLASLAAAYPADPLSLLLPLLSISSSIVGNRARIQVKESWDEPFLLWGMNVAGASVGKSPMADYLLSPLGRWVVALKDATAAAVAAWKYDKARAALSGKEAEQDWVADNPPPPSMRELMVMDATLEKIGSYLSNEGVTHGLVSFNDELSTWFAQHQRGGKGGLDQRSNWNSLWNGKALKVDRVQSESYFVAHTAVSVFGSTTLALMEAQLKAIEKASGGVPDPDGMQARFLVCLPQEILYVYNDLSISTSDLLLNFYKAIDAQVPVCNDRSKPTMVTLSDEARATLVPVFNALAQEATTSTPARAQWLGKMRGNTVRIAGALHAIRCAMAERPLTKEEISGDTAERAARFVVWQVGQYDLLMARVGGETAGVDPLVAKLLARGIEWRKKNGAAPVPLDMLRNWGLPDRKVKAKERRTWLEQTVAAVPGLGEIQPTGRSIGWLPPA